MLRGELFLHESVRIRLNELTEENKTKLPSLPDFGCKDSSPGVHESPYQKFLMTWSPADVQSPGSASTLLNYEAVCVGRL